MSDEDIPLYKVVLLGETGVGKTCIINRFSFNSYAENNESTINGSYTSKIVCFSKPNKSIRLDVWDTIGQEKYRALTQIFYKDASAAILVYDVTMATSYEQIQNYWYKLIKDTYGDNISK
jgi:small GTP-binding protein